MRQDFAAPMRNRGTGPPIPPPNALRGRLVRAGLVPAGASWHPLAGGCTGLVWRIPALGGDLICKLTPAQRESPLFPIRPRAERRLMARLAPQALAARSRWSGRHGPASVLLYRALPGAPSERLPAGLAARLAALHSLTTDAALPKRVVLVPNLVRAGRAWLAEQGAPGAILSDVDRAAGRVQTGSIVIVHGDPVPGNVLTAPGRPPALVDWQSGGRAPARHDLAVALSPGLARVYGATPPDAATRDRFLADYLEAGGREEEVSAVRTLAPAFAAQIIGHCLWRTARGYCAFAVGPAAELAALTETIA